MLKHTFYLLVFSFWLSASFAARGMTTVVYQAQNFYSLFGVQTNALTNSFSLQPWPTSPNGITTYGGFLVTGPPITITPDTNGYAKFYLYPNSYRLTISGLSQAVTLAIPDTTNVLNLVSNINSGTGTYIYTNNNNFTVYAAPGDSTPGTLLQKFQVGSGLNLATNVVGANYYALLTLQTSNSWSGSFAGNGVNLTNLQASNISPNSGTLALSVLPPNLDTNYSATTNLIATSTNTVTTNLVAYALRIGQNDTNYAFSQYQSATNVGYSFYTNSLNWATSVLNTSSNYTLVQVGILGANDTNYTTAMGLNLTNFVNTSFQAATNQISPIYIALANQGNNLTNYINQVGLNDTNNMLTISNALQSSLSSVSNQITAAKAFSCSVPNGYSSIGIGFSTPLMPDGNYSVNLTPADGNTAGAPTAGLTWYVSNKNYNGFTIYLSYATNYYLNFECEVKEHTQ